MSTACSPAPPSSPLFPYTTLFRSKPGAEGVEIPHLGQPRPASREARRRREPPDLPRDEPGEADRDRKSTRLNSSHGYISYAVFCLKKKKPQARLAFGALVLRPRWR